MSVSHDDWLRPTLSEDAPRLGRILAELVDANEGAPVALRLAFFGTAVISPLPGRCNRRL